MSHAGGGEDKRKHGAGVAPSEAATSSTESRNLIFGLVTRALKNARITLNPRQVGELVNIVVVRMKNVVRKKGAKEGAGVEDMGDDEVLKNVKEVMSGSDPEFKARLAKIIAEGPDRKNFVKELEKESSTPGIMQKIMRSLFARTKAPGAVVQTEEEEVGMVISAPIIPDPEQEAKDKLREELKNKVKPARRPFSLEQQYGRPVPPPPPRSGKQAPQTSAAVPPPLPKSRPAQSQNSSNPKVPPKLSPQEMAAKRAEHYTRAAQSSTAPKPVTHSGGPGYGGVQLKKTAPQEKTELKQEPTEFQRKRDELNKNKNSNDNPPQRGPSGSI